MSGNIGVDWSDLVGGSGVTIGVGGGSSGGAAGNPADSGGSISVYDPSNLQQFTPTTSDLVAQYGDNLAQTENPFEKTVQTGTKYIDIYIPICNPNGCRMQYFATEARPIYGDNPAYYQFESAVTSAQEELYNIEYSDYTSQANTISDNTATALKKSYDNGRFGDADGISSLINQISDLESDIYGKSLEDTLTEKYDRIADTNNKDSIEKLIADRNSLLDDLKVLQKTYDLNKKDFIQDLVRSEQKDEWDVDYFYKTAQEKFLDKSYSYEIDTKSLMTLNTTNEMNRWMAGGDLYDAPRAGDVLFNVAGNLNTVRFLGIVDTNYSPDMISSFSNPEVFKVFGSMAGDENFNIY